MIQALVNLDAYPLDRPTSTEYKQLITQQKESLATHGIVNLEDFLTSEGVDLFTQEIHDRSDVAFHNISERQPYGYDRSSEYDDDHPRNSFGRTESHRLARHHFANTKLDELYCWQPMQRFMADITSQSQVYLSGDPSNGLVVQVYKEGNGQAWHFDQALYSTILNLSEAEAGGMFECVPNIRTDTDPNYTDVKKALDGTSPNIQSHKVKAGSFTIMLGRYTLHRVTPIEKSKPRISAVLSYELEPNIHMDLATRRISFGPTAPALETDN